jgi:hypothetical protein
VTTRERAGRYLAACESPSEGGRALACFKVACKLVGVFGLTEGEAVEMLVPWSNGLPEREVRGHVRGAMRHNREVRA